MVEYIRSDLDAILFHIKIAEANAGGQPLYGPGGLIPTYNLSWGLRTVDGSYNNLLPGRDIGAPPNQPFATHVDPPMPRGRHAVRSRWARPRPPRCRPRPITIPRRPEFAGCSTAACARFQPDRRPDARQSGRDHGGAAARRIEGELLDVEVPILFTTANPLPFPVPELALGSLCKPYNCYSVSQTLRIAEHIILDRVGNGDDVPPDSNFTDRIRRLRRRAAGKGPRRLGRGLYPIAYRTIP